VDEILKYSADFDHLVIGTHGRNPLGRLFLGSVAQKVLERASCMVVVVRPAQQPSWTSSASIAEPSRCGLTER